MKRLKKELGLFDVYAISTGAMFSSGFFLLPGIAAAETGPSVVLAYFLAALLMTPAMLSMAELAAAMPRAGGTYFFLDRTMGPLVGTIGGFGTWLALVLKSAFALIGLGAYLTIYVDVPIRTTALVLTGLFALLNIRGAKESTGLQRVLVVTLIVLLGTFILSGFGFVFGDGAAGTAAPRGASGTLGEQFSPFFPFGVEGLLGTVGLVFVSFVGLTKVASIPEEVKDPDVNIPRAMILSLATATTVYVLGVFVMVAVLEPSELRGSLAPVAAAGERVLGWLPGHTGMIVIVIAAVAAFSAMANAGIMTASRYPLAMARDRLVWEGFARLGRHGTPTLAILATAGLMAVFLVALDVESVAKLASSLQLLIFAFVNLAVVVMRESGIEAYDPGFRSPLYPWIQVAGFLMPLWLMVELGVLPILFSLGVAVAAAAWYNHHGRERVDREGAVFHVFERLGRRRFEGLEPELREILREKGLRAEDPFDELVSGAETIDLEEPATFEEAVERAAAVLAGTVPMTSEELAGEFLRGMKTGITPVSRGVALPHVRLAGVDESRLVMLRAREGIETEGHAPIRAILFLASERDRPSRHLRLLAQLAGRADDDEFMREWLSAPNEQRLKEAVLHDDRYLAVRVGAGIATRDLVGRALRDVSLPDGCLVALIRREGQALVPRGDTILEDRDRLTIIGDPAGLDELRARYRGRGGP